MYRNVGLNLGPFNLQKAYIDFTGLHPHRAAKPLKQLKPTDTPGDFGPGIGAFQHAPQVFTLEPGVLFGVAVCAGHETALQLLADLAHHGNQPVMEATSSSITRGVQPSMDQLSPANDA